MSLYQELGKQLFDALNSGQSIGPLRALIDNDIDAAYDIQKELSPCARQEVKRW